jgi:hypothetical protein
MVPIMIDENSNYQKSIALIAGIFSMKWMISRNLLMRMILLEQDNIGNHR